MDASATTPQGNELYDPAATFQTPEEKQMEDLRNNKRHKNTHNNNINITVLYSYRYVPNQLFSFAKLKQQIFTVPNVVDFLVIPCQAAIKRSLSHFCVVVSLLFKTGQVCML